MAAEFWVICSLGLSKLSLPGLGRRAGPFSKPKVPLRSRVLSESRLESTVDTPLCLERNGKDPRQMDQHIIDIPLIQ